ncbi:hypothetical protein MUK60_09095 [Streptomyces sp. LRE541]|uniref:hypothetical protein n=1 Tax=Streptomyces sp. LRE541 TaxID=2931983 RepID=UPI00200C4A05|nr:hypothetical protein [Streptomyces sp. LRE541]UPZ34562.1 hypothetical protein MUK60_09095 [Streptomyces sp. LRE541]
MASPLRGDIGRALRRRARRGHFGHPNAAVGRSATARAAEAVTARASLPARVSEAVAAQASVPAQAPATARA